MANQPTHHTSPDDERRAEWNGAAPKSQTVIRRAPGKGARGSAARPLAGERHRERDRWESGVEARPLAGTPPSIPAPPPVGGAPSRPAARFTGASGSDLAGPSSRASPSGHRGLPPSALPATILRPPPALRRAPAGAEPKFPPGLRPAPSLPKERGGRSKRRCRSLGLLRRPPWRSDGRGDARHPEGATRDPAHLHLRGPSFRCRAELSFHGADPPDLGAILADARRSCR